MNIYKIQETTDIAAYATLRNSIIYYI